MEWIYLLLSGLGEIGFVTCMKLSDGFKKWKWTAGSVLSGGLSFFLLSMALKEIPMSTAYGIWTGIGAAGSVLLGMLLFNESRDRRKLLFIAMIVIGVGGLRMVGGGH